MPLCKFLLVLCSCSLLSACAEGSRPTVAHSPSVLVSASNGALLLPALFEVTLDPIGLTASVEPVASRAAQSNADLYALSIDNFRSAGTFAVEQIRLTASTLQLTYAITHPFPAPADPTAPANGASNRADLGVAGITCFLTGVADAEANTYFGDRIVNTGAVANADGYYSPYGLLPGLTGNANTFPFQTFVSEAGVHGSRVGVSNGNDPRGNYGADGWTRAELGPSRDGWTGYGVLHQGQRSRRSIDLNLDALQSEGPIRFTVALIVRYNDPRGGTHPIEKRENRLPPETPQHLKFAYRMPHGAWDLPRIAYQGESGGFIGGQSSSSTLAFQVEDWDARGVATAEADLSVDSDVTHVSPLEPGLPALAISSPVLFGDSNAVLWNAPGDLLDDDTAYGGDGDPDSGLPGDAFLFAREITKPDTVPGGGFVGGLLRAADPEDGTWDGTLVLALAPDLVPLTANLPRPVTYQLFVVNVAPP